MSHDLVTIFANAPLDKIKDFMSKLAGVVPIYIGKVAGAKCCHNAILRKGEQRKLITHQDALSGALYVRFSVTAYDWRSIVKIQDYLILSIPSKWTDRQAEALIRARLEEILGLGLIQTSDITIVTSYGKLALFWEKLDKCTTSIIVGCFTAMGWDAVTPIELSWTGREAFVEKCRERIAKLGTPVFRDRSPRRKRSRSPYRSSPRRKRSRSRSPYRSSQRKRSPSPQKSSSSSSSSSSSRKRSRSPPSRKRSRSPPSRKHSPPSRKRSRSPPPSQSDTVNPTFQVPEGYMLVPIPQFSPGNIFWPAWLPPPGMGPDGTPTESQNSSPPGLTQTSTPSVQSGFEPFPPYTGR